MKIENVAESMKAIQIVEYNKPYQINIVPTPRDLDSSDILVKIAVASNCHTDGMVQAGIFGTKLPCTASHEGAGTIVSLGSLAKNRGFKEGQRVMCGLPLHPCRECINCLGPENQTQYCRNTKGHVGVHIDGCFAEYVKVDSLSTTPLPDQVSFLSAAPLACAGRTVWRGISQTGLIAGEWIAIVGSGGGLGHLGKGIDWISSRNN
jgi:propanol-preferring alcohol dehydrogenase